MEQIINNSLMLPISEDTRAFSAALLEVEFEATGLDGFNSHTKAKYANLKGIYRAVKGALKKHNIAVWHQAWPIDGIEYLYTRLTHTPTGQFIADCRMLISEKPGNQGMGTANTYVKRYALLSLCAIAPSDEEDDDGQAEEQHIASLISNAQLNTLETLLDSCSNAQELIGSIRSVYKINNLSQLKYELFNVVKMYIEKNRE